MSDDSHPGGRNRLATKPDDDARQRDDVRQDAMLQVDDEEHDQRAGEHQPHEQQRRQAVDEHAAGEHDALSSARRADRSREMRAPHVRQRPRSTSQPMTGMFSNHASGRLHAVQCDAGQTTDSRRGSR